MAGAWRGEPARNFGLGVLRYHRLSLPPAKYPQHADDKGTPPGHRRAEEAIADAAYWQCCRLNIHKRTVVPCPAVSDRTALCFCPLERKQRVGEGRAGL